ncbi:KEOPS complex subunit Pcc1 [Geoglobus acetivorans]|uniref:Uncharacterized protein n=1 Tax=Geoglobus acetivorans TaxID=565033 RepID=A0A0A7GBP4_GEOAI|nr:hypothetical protein GACE_0391 [Geoglobus acetivorans]
MLFSVKLVIDEGHPEIISKALMPDDLEWAKSQYEDGRLVVEVKTHKIGALINAVEDFFMNIKASSSALNALERF